MFKSVLGIFDAPTSTCLLVSLYKQMKKATRDVMGCGQDSATYSSLTYIG